MSGPKVVRVITAEEMREISRGHIARLEAALAQWERACQRADAASGDEVQAARGRVLEIAALLASGAHAEVQRRAPAETAWLLEDIERRLEAEARRKADVKASAGRRQRLAVQLLERTAGPLPLRRELEAIARGDADAEKAEGILAEALRHPAAASNENPAAQAELAALGKRLSAGLQGQTFDQWLATNVSEPAGLAEDKISLDLATLALLGAEREAEAFARRYTELQSLPDTSSQKMRLDSLRLEMARCLDTCRAHARALEELELVLSEARSVLSEALLHDAIAALQARNGEVARQVSKRLADAISVERQAKAAAARRLAVLSALADVGYAAHEGMATATSSTGQMVLRRASNPEMGVEIAGGGARLQLRPVRFAAPGAARDTDKDRDIETIWCSDFDGLRGRLQALGGEVALEKAFLVGAVPVVMIEDPGISRSRDVAAPVQQVRRD